MERINDPIGEAPFDLIINKDEDHHNQISRHEESTLCDLITDSIRYIGEGNITIMSAGSVRTDLKKGNVTYQKILDILPFINPIIVKEVSGQDYLDALEYGVRLLPETSSRFPQVSGINFKVNLFVPSTIEIDITPILLPYYSYITPKLLPHQILLPLLPPNHGIRIEDD